MDTTQSRRPASREGDGVRTDTPMKRAAQREEIAPAFIFMADRWQPRNAIDGRHLWLPIQFKDGLPFVEWLDFWDLSFFDRTTGRE